MMVARSNILNILGVMTLVMSIAACSGRSKRAIEDRPPAPAGGETAGPGDATNGGDVPPTILPDTNPTPDPSVNPDGNPDGNLGGDQDPPIVPGTNDNPDTPDTPNTPNVPGTDNNTPDSTNVNLDVTLDNGENVQLEWDGSTFKGNSKWNVVPVQ